MYGIAILIIMLLILEQWRKHQPKQHTPTYEKRYKIIYPNFSAKD